MSGARGVMAGRVGFVQQADLSPGFFEDMQALRPTWFLGMSYLWQDLYSMHQRRLLPRLQALLAARLPGADGAATAACLQAQRPLLWDELVAALLRTRAGMLAQKAELDTSKRLMGGSLAFGATGGSHTPPEVKEFVAALLPTAGCLSDSYGSTEFPGISNNGVIGADVELKLVPVVRVGEDRVGEDGKLVEGKSKTLYSPDERPFPRGEIVVRRKDGTQTAYFGNAAETAKAWKGGWYYTGDVGQLEYISRMPSLGAKARVLQDARKLSIIDRVKSLEELYWQHDSKWIEVGAMPCRAAPFSLSRCRTSVWHCSAKLITSRPRGTAKQPPVHPSQQQQQQQQQQAGAAASRRSSSKKTKRPLVSALLGPLAPSLGRP